MTVTKCTVADVLQIIADLRGESTVDTSAKRIRLVSRAYSDFSTRTFWRTHYLRDQTSVATSGNSYTIGSATYPMRPKGLAEVFVGGTTDSYRYKIVDYNVYKNIISSNSAEQVVYEWYDAVNDLWKMYINPAPTIGDTITYSYFWEPPVLTLTTEGIICPNPDIIAYLALSDILESEMEDTSETRNQAEQMINELMGKENSPAQNQLYSFGNSVGTKGIGTY